MMRHFPKTLSLGFALLVALSLLALTAAQQTDALAQGDLTRYWRPAYDILVRPMGSRRSVETEHGLVAPNFALTQAGGISPAQLEAIRRVPGVALAAPIAPLGYVSFTARGDTLAVLKQPNRAYRHSTYLVLDDGVRRYTLHRQHYFVTTDDPSPPLLPGVILLPKPPFPPWEISSDVQVPVSVAGIDPQAEDQLVHLSRAVVSGKPLAPGGVRFVEPPERIAGPPSEENRPRCKQIDVLFHRRGFAHLTAKTEIVALRLPKDFRLEEWKGKPYAAWETFLSGLAADHLVALKRETGSTLYSHLVNGYLALNGLATVDFIPFSTAVTFVNVPGPAEFAGKGTSVSMAPLHLVLQPIRRGGEVWGGYSSEVPQYRFLQKRDVGCVEFRAVGVYDIARLPQQDKVNKVPMELYAPPDVYLEADTQGKPVNPPKPLYPTLNPAGYLQPPPLALTTVEAACKVVGRQDCISAVRVRVAGISEMSSEAQAKIEAVAGEIHRRTGLEVDIMVGSSPTRVLVDVPDVGPVEEHWIRKGVSTAYRQRINLGQWLFLLLLMVTGALYSGHQGWLALLRQQEGVALRKAVGWRTGALYRLTLGPLLLAAALGAGLGAAAAMGLMVVWHHSLLTWWLYAAVPLGFVAAFGVGALPTATRIAHLPPASVLRQGGVRGRGKRRWRARSLWGYSLLGWRRRPSRAAAMLAAYGLSAALVVLLAAILADRQAYLSTSLLGEYILLHLGPEHGVMAGLTLALAALLTAEDLAEEVATRRRELGVLAAVGWRGQALGGMVVREGLLGGVLGGLLGGLAAWGAYGAMYGASPQHLPALLALGIALPALIGALAAWAPARRAARIPPAQVLRGE